MKKLFFIGFLAVILIIPTIATADQVFIGGPRDVTGEIENKAPVNWANLRYVTVTPKRCFDSRFDYFGGIVPAQTEVILALDTSCDIPWPEAKAVHINMAVFQSDGAGNLRAFAYGDPVPGTAVLNFGNIPGLFAISNAAIIPLCGQDDCFADISFWASKTCNFTVDVFGYFRF